MAQYVVDRFEGAEWAVLETSAGKLFNVPRGWLPGSAREGDVITVEGVLATDAHVLRIQVESDGREERLADASRRRETLTKGPKGDISLL